MILEQFNLTGKVAIVTGARRGLGYGMAEGLAEAGADIVAVGANAMPEIEASIKKLGRKFIHIEADLVSQDKIQYIVDETIKQMGRIDILVNNAGTIRRDDIFDFSEKDWDDVMNVNLKSIFFLSQAVAKKMVEQKINGRIINTSSLLAFQGGIRVPSYTSSKSGLDGLTKLMANELAKYNITVNAIAPGYMATNNTDALQKDPVRSAEILNRIPMGKWGDKDDMKGAVVFLASQASSYVTGSTVLVDGGWMAR